MTNNRNGSNNRIGSNNIVTRPPTNEQPPCPNSFFLWCRHPLFPHMNSYCRSGVYNSRVFHKSNTFACFVRWQRRCDFSLHGSRKSVLRRRWPCSLGRIFLRQWSVGISAFTIWYLFPCLSFSARDLLRYHQGVLKGHGSFSIIRVHLTHVAHDVTRTRRRRPWFNQTLLH